MPARKKRDESSKSCGNDDVVVVSCASDPSSVISSGVSDLGEVAA